MGKQLKQKEPLNAFAIVMWVLGVLSLFPFIMMVVISFRASGDAYKPIFAPVSMTLKNYKTVLGNDNFFNWYSNTIVTVCVTIILRLAVTIPASFAFSRMQFKGRTIIWAILIATMMVPGETTMVPRYLYFKQIHLLDSIWVIILPEVSEVFYLMLLTEFFSSVPEDFLEAARIDGASNLRIMLQIFIPLSGASIATAVLFSFINIWNNFIDPYLFINTISKQLITPALKFFQERGGANIPMQLAGASMAIVPVIILFIVTQKYFVAGVSSSGIKG
ncbi:carbohydrate ABC transporter permease [Bullifex porci]|uniref:Carbohydrate ABC transporter permease n=1 Tax=Bullifex porci TaxID=2606638 RepID=A0A7X2PDI3_9SPIO|nr:carbohydrate ABC transporter permease [Bullifex porci]MDD7255236.1 carbohydrate ABC transporter permease [Bullifex porci]MDD7589563.1 carbohydrate ABC transporter permease [Bullifex porci]MDY2741927.1 carbohydrate ABC transporter permease [Bullifex porci]MSU06370.1 carbohydrate ABC transporter permease [Bullifex porci]